MKRFRLACALAVTILGAATIAQAQGKPSFASDPPNTLKEHVCSLLPSAAAEWVPFCN
jgi:hypothetical protein